MKYIALLRGINVGGNNIIAMPALKAAFEKQGFKKVLTYINSGNVIFESNDNESKVKADCEELIIKNFGLRISVCLITAAELTAAIANAPEWWNEAADSKHNAIFVMPPMSAAAACKEIGETKPEHEMVACHGKVIFWSAPLATFSRARWANVVKNKKVYNAITIRNANTTLKLAEMIKDEV